jgi:hypothetical protein
MLSAATILTACQTSRPTAPVSRPEAQIHSEPMQADGVYKHQYSSLQFPPTIEDFTRIEMRRYDTGASDVSATYQRSGSAGAALGTIYIYPAPWIPASGQYPDLTDRQLGGLCRNELESAKAAVVSLHPDARIVQEGGQVLKNSAGGRVGLGRVVYKMTDTFDGRVQPMQSQLYVMCFGWSQWILKYRLTAPQGVDLDAVYRTLGGGIVPHDSAATPRS